MKIINSFDPINAGKKLRNLRLKEGLTAKQFAEIIGSTEASICAYERGSRVPVDPVKVKIANYFEMTVQDLFF